MMKMEAACGAEKVRMVQMLTEPNLWRIVEGEGSKKIERGRRSVCRRFFWGETLYVDLMIEEVRRKRETSAPEQLGEESSQDRKRRRFLSTETYLCIAEFWIFFLALFFFTARGVAVREKRESKITF